MKSYSTIKRELLKNAEVHKAYKVLEPEFSIVHALIEKRLKQGMTQADLARKIGTKQSAIARLESGTYNPTIKFLEKVTDALDAKLVVLIS